MKKIFSKRLWVYKKWFFRLHEDKKQVENRYDQLKHDYEELKKNYEQSDDNLRMAREMLERNKLDYEMKLKELEFSLEKRQNGNNISAWLNI